MARKVNTKSGKQPQTASNNATLKSNTTNNRSGPPSPFEYAHPDLVRLFLSKLPQTHVYLTHIDTTPRTQKRQVFLAPSYINFAIVAILGLRLYYAAPTYLNIVIQVLGYDFSGRNKSNLTIGKLLGTVVGRFLLFLLDYALFVLGGSFPWEFMFGNKYNGNIGPVSWRTKLGFQDREIVVRRSKAWDQSLASAWTTDHELTLKLKIRDATTAQQLEKSGYLLVDKNWDLDFRAILQAHKLVESNILNFSDFENVAFVFHDNKWLAWTFSKPKQLPAEKTESSQMRNFKDKCTAVGCEDLFYRWIEIIQFESSVPGGFTDGKKSSAMRDFRDLMTARGVDYSKFMSELGRQGLPGIHDEEDL